MQLKYLPNIKTPKDIKDYSSDQLHELCAELRNHTIETVTEVGGHLAPTLGVIELSVALHYVYDMPRDKLIWDVGHQGYAHKLLTGRFKDFSTIRQYNGLSGFLKRSTDPRGEVVWGLRACTFPLDLSMRVFYTTIDKQIPTLF